jgi:hypothetical protein
MKINKILIGMIVVSSLFSFKSDTIKITWNELAKIDYFEKEISEYEIMYVPIISDKIKKLNKKTLKISGFVIPVDDNVYALSKNKYSSCFFCGKAGPESVIGLTFKSKIPLFKTDDFITVIGEFKVNDKNPDDWVYSMIKVIIVK